MATYEVDSLSISKGGNTYNVYADRNKRYSTLAGFPQTGKNGYLYIAEDTGYIYIWDATSSTYIPVGGIKGQVPVASGGTGAANAADARANLGIISLPEVTSSDNGKFLTVQNGAWAATSMPNAEGVNF